MGKIFYSEDGPPQRIYVPVQSTRRRYGCFGFLFDCFMTFLTGGLWLIWVFVREMRRR